MRKGIAGMWMAGMVSLLLVSGGCGDQAARNGPGNGSGAGPETEEASGIQESREAEEIPGEISQDTPESKEAEEKAGQERAEEAVTFTDDRGREITLKNPEKAAALIGSFADVWQLAGGEVSAAVNDAWESLDLGLGQDTVNLGSILEPDVEQLIAVEPDLVLASANMDAHLGLEDALTQAGLAVAYFDVSNFEQYLHMLEICTRLTGRQELYEQNGLRVREQIERAIKRADGSEPVVLFLRASSTNIRARGSGDSVGGEILSDLGCVNLADQDESLLEDLSMEAIIAADPAYIFITAQGQEDAARACTQEQLLSNPAWSGLTAVKNERYYFLDKNLFFLKPNARWGEAYEQLADILYPEE